MAFSWFLWRFYFILFFLFANMNFGLEQVGYDVKQALIFFQNGQRPLYQRLYMAISATIFASPILASDISSGGPKMWQRKSFSARPRRCSHRVPQVRIVTFLQKSLDTVSCKEEWNKKSGMARFPLMLSCCGLTPIGYSLFIIGGSRRQVHPGSGFARLQKILPMWSAG